MAKRIAQNELDRILRAVAGFPEGAGLGTISKALDNNVPRRTLQRRLALLVKQNKLAIDGQARASRYRLAEGAGAAAATLPVIRGEKYDEVYVPLSPEGEEIKQMVRQPIQNRRPVGYNRDFLDVYHPNATFYLSEDIRSQLAGIGCPQREEQPAGTYALKIFNRLLIDLSWNSCRLEGNTYSLLETERLLELGEEARGKNTREAQMIRTTRQQ
jgi:hypothetical protein